MFFFDDPVNFTDIAGIGDERRDTVGQDRKMFAHDARLFECGGPDFIDIDVFAGLDPRLNLQQLGSFALAFDAGFQKQLRQFRVRYGPRLGGQRRHTIQHGVLLLMLLVRLPGGFAAGFQYGVGLYWIDLAIGEGEDTFADKFADILPGHASALGISVLRQQSGGTVV